MHLSGYKAIIDFGKFVRTCHNPLTLKGPLTILWGLGLRQKGLRSHSLSCSVLTVYAVNVVE